MESRKSKIKVLANLDHLLVKAFFLAGRRVPGRKSKKGRERMKKG
jgi:hypothetical protein